MPKWPLCVRTPSILGNGISSPFSKSLTFAWDYHRNLVSEENHQGLMSKQNHSSINQPLFHSFHGCLRYKQAHPLTKPLLNPSRFIRNQVRPKRGITIGTVETVDTFHMKDFTIVAGEAVSEVLAGYGIMEAELTEAFLHLVKPGQTAIDIGMHLGYFTTLFASLVGPSGKVHAFEPTPSTREIAAHNTERFSNVTVHPNAMWSHHETMTFHDYGLAHMAFNSVTSARMDHEIVTVREHQVSAISLDEFREQLASRIDVIKIDAETAEEQILKGGQKVFSTDRPIVTLEVGDEAADAGRSLRLIETLAAMDYDAWEFTEGRFQRHVRREIYEYDNLIFSPVSVDLSL